MADWIETFVAQTQGIAPLQFTTWTAISSIAAVLERRVWTKMGKGLLYPNLYTVLCGEPGSGKTISVKLARSLLGQIDNLSLAPDSISNASFMDALYKSCKPLTNGGGISIYAAMTVAADELGVLIPRYDMEFLSTISYLYDNHDRYRAPRRTSVSLDIEKPTINILCGATPDFLGDILPEVAWGQGFTARLFFIYSPKIIDTNADLFTSVNEFDFAGNLAYLTDVFRDFHGEFEWEEKARREINLWNNAGRHPVPEHMRLRHYSTRRDIHTVKLAMISAVASGAGLFVRDRDFERARDWLLTAEKLMPDVFRAMAQKSDQQLIRDLHYEMYTKWSRGTVASRKPIKEEELWNFLHERIPSDRIKGLIETAVKSGYFRQAVFPGEYIPRSLNDRVENI